MIQNNMHSVRTEWCDEWSEPGQLQVHLFSELQELLLQRSRGAEEQERRSVQFKAKNKLLFCACVLLPPSSVIHTDVSYRPWLLRRYLRTSRAVSVDGVLTEGGRGGVGRSVFIW